jgi:two-component system, OmpR family, phosphate regulon sensor histidine kinase PhoR
VEQADLKATLQLLADVAYDALFVLDTNYAIVSANSVAESLFNQPDLVGQNLIDLTQSPELQAIIASAVEYGEEALEEQMVLEKRFYRVRVRVVGAGQDCMIGLALQDVSELVRLNRARRDMVANISHEMRTPVANIRSIIDALFLEDEKPKRKRSISSVQAIARETDALLWVIQEMMDLSMIESGQAILRLVEVKLNTLIDDAVDRMLDQADAKDIKLETDVPKSLRVWCDWDQMRRVLINLIHNAIKWSPRGGRISVRAYRNQDEIIIQVTDNGPGVPDAQVDRIFERFYQVDPSRSGTEGTGLGLAICKHIVEAHEGRIWAEGASKGQGGSFLFTLMSAESHDA